MQSLDRELELRVVGCTLIAADVLGFSLASPTGAQLPAWEPGAHLDIHLPSGLVRQYSLCGDPADRSTYDIAVLREQAGRGGSAEVHSTQLVGQTLVARGPKNHFAMADAEHYVLLAGGIGITPIKAMAQRACRIGASWELHYGGRSRSSMAFANELAALDPARVALVPEDEVGILDLPAILRAAPLGSAVHCCGPGGMISAAREITATRPDLSFHFEQFVANADIWPPSSAVRSERDAGAFEVVLRRSGLTLTVGPGQSILSVIRAAGVDVESSCEDGFCGTCETAVMAGVPDHFDTVLTEAERGSNQTMMICVSRAATGSRLELDR